MTRGEPQVQVVALAQLDLETGPTADEMLLQLVSVTTTGVFTPTWRNE